jgi:hypothetical protein
MRSGAIDKLMFFASLRQMRRVDVSLLPWVSDSGQPFAPQEVDERLQLRRDVRAAR